MRSFSNGPKLFLTFLFPEEWAADLSFFKLLRNCNFRLEIATFRSVRFAGKAAKNLGSVFARNHFGKMKQKSAFVVDEFAAVPRRQCQGVFINGKIVKNQEQRLKRRLGLSVQGIANHVYSSVEALSNLIVFLERLVVRTTIYSTFATELCLIWNTLRRGYRS